MKWNELLSPPPNGWRVVATRALRPYAEVMTVISSKRVQKFSVGMAIE